MARKRLTEEKISAVLLKSRRRCCVCFGLNRDTGLKAGQIAHLDHRSSNDSESNLAFLCFVHHDEYDSKTSQSKGFTQKEVLIFREELYRSLGEYLAKPVHFGFLTLPVADPYAGAWVRLGGLGASAEIELTPIGDSLQGEARYAVSGLALWGENREFGPNIGELSFIGEVVDGQILHFGSELHRADDHQVTLSFRGGEMIVQEENWFGQYGMNVNFNGRYQRAR